MSHQKTLFKIAGALGAAALTFSLAACSGGQSVAEACKIADSTANNANSDMQRLMQEAFTGKGDVASALDPINKALNEAQAKVTNEKVSAELKAVTRDMKALTDTLKSIKIPDTSKLDPTDASAMAEMQKMQEEMTALSPKIQEQSQALTDSGQKLQKVCGAG